MVLTGRLVPFGVSTIGVVEPALGLLEQIDRGAFGPEAVSADAVRFCHFRINHDRAAMPPGARVELFTRWTGLYVRVTLPDSPEARAISAARDRWLGWSMSYDKADTASHVDWPRRTRHLSRVGFVSQASLVTTGRSAYPSTWVMEDGPEARARIERENRMQPDADRGGFAWPGRLDGRFHSSRVGCSAFA